MSDKEFGKKPIMIKASETKTGPFYLIKALAESEVNVKQNWENSDAVENIEMPAFTVLEQITEVEVISGTVLGFRE